MHGGENVIEVKNLRKAYKNLEAVKGISFSVGAKEIFGILGPNGAGKTTTLEMIEGLKKQTSGEIRVLGLNNREHEKEIKKRIGVQLQSSEYLNDLSLSELITLFASLYGQKTDPVKVLDKVGLREKAASRVKQLSGGQKQRFTIATALVHKPEIIFLDEPTTGLDPHARREMWKLVQSLNEQDITVVITTHYMEEAEYLCDRVAIMEQGKILKMDSPEGLIQSLGKGYSLSFFTDNPLPKDFFDQFKNYLTEVINEFPKTTVEMDDLEILPKIIEKLKTQKIHYKFFNLQTPKLEDVYLRLTGHSYEQA